MSTTMRRTLLPTLAGLLLVTIPAFAAPPSIEFNRDIRPILADACFHCHGYDKAKRKADLRLDTEEGGKSVVSPGNPDESELIERITTTDPSRRMPPPKSGRTLSPRQSDL